MKVLVLQRHASWTNEVKGLLVPPVGKLEPAQQLQVLDSCFTSVTC